MGTGKAIIPNKFVDACYEGKYLRAQWPGAPAPPCNAGDGYSDPTGTTGDVNVGHFPGLFPVPFAYRVNGAFTAVAPIYQAAGAGLLGNIEDGTIGDGVEYVFGADHDGAPDANNPLGQTVGSDNGTFIRLKTVIETVDGQDHLAVGFRKAEAYQADIEDYDAMAVLDVMSGDINVGLIVSGEATDFIDTGLDWADGEEHEFEVHVLGNVVNAFVDGAQVFNRQHFLDAEELVPMIYSFQGLATSSDVLWKELEVGQLWLKGEDPNFR
jgi:hypothetical protein